MHHSGRDNLDASSSLYHASTSTSSHPHSSPRVPSSPSSSAANHSKHLSTISTVTGTSVSTEAASASPQQPLLHRRYSAAAQSAGTSAEHSDDPERRRKKRRKQKKRKRPGMGDKERKSRSWNDEAYAYGQPARLLSSRPTARRLLVSKVILEAVLGTSLFLLVHSYGRCSRCSRFVGFVRCH
jgi:hypothetical protein